MNPALVDCVETSTGKYVKVPESMLQENPRRFRRMDERMLSAARQLGLQPEFRGPDQFQHLIEKAYSNLLEAQARNNRFEIPIREAELERLLDRYLGRQANKVETETEVENELPPLRPPEPRQGSAVVEMWID